MKDIEVKVSKKTRFVDLSTSTIGNDSENLQERFVFSFTDEFVNGQARLETTIGGESSYIELTREGEIYYCPIRSAITKQGKIDMQLVITEGTSEEEIPIFKSNIFYVYCNASINAEHEQPEEYPEWIDIADTKLNQMDNFDIDATKTGDTATITITQRDGTEKSVEITDGETGPAGQDAKINGVNTLNIQAGDNINISQSGSTMTISATGGGGGSTYTAGTGIEITQQNVINNTLPSKIITVNADPQTMQLDKNADEIEEYLNNGYIVMALGYQVFRKDYNASTHTIQLAVYFGSFGQVITVVGNQVTNVNEYYYASDYNYVHTDNNFSYSYKDKLDNAPEVVDLSNLSIGSNITDSETITKLKNPRVVVKYNDTYFRFAKIYGSGYVFTVMNSMEGGEYITLNWTGSLFNFYEHGNANWEIPSNRVQNLNNPTTQTYPSTLAVYNALQDVGGDSHFVDMYYNFNSLTTSQAQKIIDAIHKNGNITEVYLAKTNDAINYGSDVFTKAYLSHALSSSRTSYTLYFYQIASTFDAGAKYSIIYKSHHSITISWNNDVPTVSSVSGTATNDGMIWLWGDGNNQSWTPSTNYSPANKKYVDDSIASAITTTLGGSY